MSQLVLLIIGAMWMAVLLPPLLRSRFDGGAVSSVSDFRRQLNTLQRSQVPGTQGQMRAMVRPLAPSPRTSPMVRQNMAPRGAQPRHRLVASDGMLETEPRHRRTHHTAELPRAHYAAETAFMSPREVVRRRRVNVLYGMIAANAVTLFLGLTTGSTAMVYGFTVAFLGLAAYCYVLVQLRNQEYLRRYYGQRRAA